MFYPRTFLSTVSSRLRSFQSSKGICSFIHFPYWFTWGTVNSIKSGLSLSVVYNNEGMMFQYTDQKAWNRAVPKHVFRHLIYGTWVLWSLDLFFRISSTKCISPCVVIYFGRLVTWFCTRFLLLSSSGNRKRKEVGSEEKEPREERE